MRKILLVVLLFVTSIAFGQTYSWTGAGDGVSWEDSGNWSGGNIGGYPGDTDDDDIAIINAVGTDYSIEYATTVTIQSIDMSTSSGGSILLTVNGTLDVADDFEATGDTQIFNLATINVQGDFILDAIAAGLFSGTTTSIVNFNGSVPQSMAGSPNYRNVTINNSNGVILDDDATITRQLNIQTGTLAIGANSLSLNRTISGSGTLTGSASSNLSISGTLTSFGTLTFTSGAQQLNNFTLNKSAGTTATLGSPLTVSGSLALTNGTLNLNGNTLTANGAITRTSGIITGGNTSTFVVGGSGSLPATFNIDGTGINLTMNRASTTFTIADATTLNNLIISAGTFNKGSNDLSITGDLTNNDTFASSGGTTTLNGTSSQTLSGSSITGVNNLTINNSNGIVLNNQLSVSGVYNQSAGAVSGSGLLVLEGDGTVSGLNISGISLTLDRPQPLTFTSTTSLGSLSILQGSIDIGTNILNLTGDLDISSTLTANDGTLRFNGSSLQTISGTVATPIENMVIANGVTNDHTAIDIENSITFEGTNKVLDADGAGSGEITLLSVSETGGTAYVGEMINGNQIAGDITVQRYIDEQFIPQQGGGTTSEVYRYLTSPLEGVTVADWQEEVVITGDFTGRSPCIDQDCNPNAPSLFSYHEPRTGSLSDGYDIHGFPAGDTPGGTNQTMFEKGRGYALFIRDFDISGGLILDMTGTVSNNTDGSFDFGISYTQTSPEGTETQSEWSNANDGWNLIGNPFLSNIDWDNAGWNASNVWGTVVIKDNYGKEGPAGDHVIYNGSIVSPEGATWDGVIAMGQGFWVQAFASPASLSASQSVKTSSNAEHLFRAASNNTTSPTHVFRIKMAHKDYKDEAVIHFRDGATNGLDYSMDAPKFYNGHINVMAKVGDKDLTINSLPLNSCDAEVQLSLRTHNTLEGNYTLNFSGFDLFDPGFQVTLNDNYLNKRIKIKQGDTYNFAVNKDRLSTQNRFTLAFKNISKGGGKKGNDCNDGLARLASDTEMAEVKIYPNPAFELLNIMLPTEHGAELEIISVDGRVIRKENLVSGRNVINIANLKRGIYIIKINGEAIYHTERIAKD